MEDEFGEGSVARPNRDTRFSPDKSPYKNRAYARISRDGGGGYYVQLSADGLFVGSGIYMPERSALAAIRAAVDDDRRGRQLERIVAGLEADGIELMEDGVLKTAPRGYAVDHPRIRFLRLVHLAAGTQFPVRKWLHTASAKDRIVEGWRRLTPLMRWAADAMG